MFHIFSHLYISFQLSFQVSFHLFSCLFISSDLTLQFLLWFFFKSQIIFFGAYKGSDKDKAVHEVHLWALSTGHFTTFIVQEIILPVDIHLRKDEKARFIDYAWCFYYQNHRLLFLTRQVKLPQQPTKHEQPLLVINSTIQQSGEVRMPATRKVRSPQANVNKVSISLSWVYHIKSSCITNSNYVTKCKRWHGVVLIIAKCQELLLLN